MSNKERSKGVRIEREIVALHVAIGVEAERYPLSGASHFQGKNHDVNIYAFGIDAPPLKAEVKARKEGSGTKLFDKWMAGHDMLITKSDRAKPTVHLTWDAYQRMLQEIVKWRRGRNDRQLVETLEKLALGAGGGDAKTEAS